MRHTLIFIILLIFTSRNQTQLIGQEKGFAINYKESDASRVTYSSELYDPNQFTAAHNTIPIGTMVNVVRLDNGQSVLVRINDRGPFTPNRILALSKAAANKIGLKRYEKVWVQLTIVTKKEAENITPVEKKPIIPFYQPGSTVQQNNEKPKERIELEVKPTENQIIKSDPELEKVTPNAPSSLLKKGLYQLRIEKLINKGFAIQIGSFQNTAILWNEISKLHNAWFKQILVQTDENETNKTLHKLLLGPFPTREKAENYKINLKKNYNIDGFIVNLNE